ncbi:MAG: ATP-binding protein [Chloracidobacterium sp.]|nr:ATP-binding protein [Chloracidobacterium sp.]
MNAEIDNWEENNQRYLAAALEWLRLRLTRLAQQGTPLAAPIDSAPPQGAPSARGRRFWGKRESDSPPRALLPPASDSSVVSDEQVSQAAEAVAAAESATPPPAMMTLGRNFGLSRFEREILLLCAAMEMDTRVAALCARAQDNSQRPHPTFALAMALFDDPEWSALSPEGALRHWRFIEINQPGAQPLTMSALRADERIVNFLKGLNYLDDRLAPLLAPLRLSPGDADLPPSQRRAAETILMRLKRAAAAEPLPVIQLLGSDSASKRRVAQEVAATLGLRLYRLPSEMMPSHAAELETLARLAERETALWLLAIYLDSLDHRSSENSGTSEISAASINRFLSRGNGVVFLDTLDVRRGLNRESVTIEITKPARSEQRSAWEAALGADSGGLAETLSAQFNLNQSAIQRIAAEAGGQTPDDSSARLGRLWGACLEATRPALDGLAQRIEPKATWDDIALPDPELKLLRQIAAQVRRRGQVYETGGFAASRSRGLSINALFAGESGTGKTMAAEVIANDLKLDLYRIDLSSVVNKYIGETEKNLRRLFDAAEDGGVILFFDEADALFGRRSEVKDSHDRYANIEINYLLQRLEAFTGLAIMATNMKSALDAAFVRRIRFIVEFRAHGPAERKLIWQRIFPVETKTAGLDYDRLARLNLNGGGINNVAINAAFLAAQEGTEVKMPHVLEAARTEFMKLKRPISETDFIWKEPAGAAA